MTTAAKIAARREATRRYRATHRRFDYAPSASVLGIIERHLAAGLDKCQAGVIDALIVAGDRAISSGNKDS